MKFAYRGNASKWLVWVIIVVLQLGFGDYSLVQATTRLIFRAMTSTPSGAVSGVSIRPGANLRFDSIDVSPYRKIRIMVTERAGSASKVTVRLIMMEGSDSVGELEPVTLSPGSSQSKIFDVPGTRLGLIVEAQAAPVAGSDVLQILIYGSD